MHNAITHHPEPDAQPTPKQWSLSLASSPSYILSMASYAIEYPVWLVWVNCPGRVPSQPLVKINSIPAETRTVKTIGFLHFTLLSANADQTTTSASKLKFSDMQLLV